jgi:hypothetical protein
MTETEWLACDDPQAMLKSLGDDASDRTLRLFAVACCRRIGRMLPDARSWAALEAAEGYADRFVSAEQLAATVAPADEATSYAYHRRGQHFFSAAGATLFAALPTGFTLPANWTDELRRFSPANICEWAADALEFEAPRPDGQAAVMAEGRAQGDLLRDIFGNPFRLVAVDPDWLTWNGGTVPKIAQTIYAERRFQDLPILADALEEAGCTNADILDHCRRPGEHVRGCWVVDLLLGKE